MTEQRNVMSALTRSLVEKLGTTLVAVISGTRQRSDVPLWIEGATQPTTAQLGRLMFAQEVFGRIADNECDDVARSWFVGGNVGNDEVPPVMAIRNDRFDEVTASADRLIYDRWND